jgi:hypothetical protein
MKILIVDSEDNPTPHAEGLAHFLGAFNGPWKYAVSSKKTKEGTFYIDEDFDPDRSVLFSKMEAKMMMTHEPIEPWESIFDRIEALADDSEVTNADFTILITEEYNEYNWFSGVDPDRVRPYGFIQGTHWDSVVMSDALYPILYECVALPLRYRMFGTARKIQHHAHTKPKGCINDLCQDREEVILRLQTGSLCDGCIQLALDRGVSHAELDQVDALLDAIRVHFRAFNRRRAQREPELVRVLKNGRRIMIGDVLLQMRPLEKALYVFFLQASEPLSTADLSDYEQELESIYSPLFTGGERSDMKRIVWRLAHNQDGLTNQTVSRINRTIDKWFMPEIAAHYKIETGKDGLKRIAAQMKME